MLTTRVGPQNFSINPFLLIGTGFQVLDIGEIITHRTYIYGNSGQRAYAALAAFGLGFDIPISSSITLLLEGKLTGTSYKGAGFIALTSSIRFAL